MCSGVCFCFCSWCCCHCFMFFWRPEQDLFPQESHGTGRSPKSVGGDVEEVSRQKSHRTGRSPKSVGGNAYIAWRAAGPSNSWKPQRVSKAHAAGRGSRGQCPARRSEKTGSRNPVAGPNSPQRVRVMTPAMRAAHPAIPAAHRVAVQAGSMSGRALLRWNEDLPRQEKPMLLQMHPQRLPVAVRVREDCAA